MGGPFIIDSWAFGDCHAPLGRMGFIADVSSVHELAAGLRGIFSKNF
jgi:hypothetical protein